MEDRLHDLEQEVATIRVDVAKIGVTLTHTDIRISSLNDQLARLADVVGTLNEILSKGKGALWIAGILAVGVGAFIHYIVDALVGHVAK